jgi:hypothetical protein
MVKTIAFSISNQAVTRKVNFLLLISLCNILIISQLVFVNAA